MSMGKAAESDTLVWFYVAQIEFNDTRIM